MSEKQPRLHLSPVSWVARTRIAITGSSEEQSFVPSPEFVKPGGQLSTNALTCHSKSVPGSAQAGLVIGISEVRIEKGHLLRAGAHI